jgi:hypothetical protein
MSAEHWASMTTHELEALKRKKIRAHDVLIDTAEMGDDRIYFLGKDIDAINAELRKRAQQG